MFFAAILTVTGSISSICMSGLARLAVGLAGALIPSMADISSDGNSGGGKMKPGDPIKAGGLDSPSSVKSKASRRILPGDATPSSPKTSALF